MDKNKVVEKRQADFRTVSFEVLYSDGAFLSVDATTVDLLRARAREAPRKRCRLCFHADIEAVQQEMLIVMNRASYVRPHRHLDKVETLAVVDGCADAVVFDQDGTVADVIRMTGPQQGGAFFYRMPAGIFHTLVFRTEWFVFVETTIGPFDRAATEAADWAPSETDPDAGHAYLSGLLPRDR